MARFFIPDTSTRIYYYVAKAGNDSTGDGSIGNPYATINKSMQVLNAYSGGLIPVVVIGADVWQEAITYPTKNIELRLLNGAIIDMNGANYFYLTPFFTSIIGDNPINCRIQMVVGTGRWCMMSNYGTNPLFLKNVTLDGLTTINAFFNITAENAILSNIAGTGSVEFVVIATNSFFYNLTNCLYSITNTINSVFIRISGSETIYQGINNHNNYYYGYPTPTGNWITGDPNAQFNDYANKDFSLKSSSALVGTGQYGANIGPLGTAKSINGKADAIQNAQFSKVSGTPDIVYDNTSGILTLNTAAGEIITAYIDRGAATKIQRIGQIGTTIYDSNGNPTQQVDINNEGGLFPMMCLGIRYGNSINAFGEIDYKFNMLSATASSGQPSLTVTSNTSFVAGDKVILVKSDGTMELAVINTLSSTTGILLTSNLTNSYASSDKIYGYKEVVENMPLLIDGSGRTTGDVNFDISTAVQISARFVQLIVKMHT